MDIKEQAQKAALERVWKGRKPLFSDQKMELGPGDWILVEALTDMYLAGYEAHQKKALEAQRCTCAKCLGIYGADPYRDEEEPTPRYEGDD